MNTAQTATRTLLQISEDMQALDRLMEELGGDVSNPDVEAVVTEWFGSMGAERDKKLDNYCTLIRELELRMSLRKAEADRLAMRVKTDANKVDFLKGRLKQFFEANHLSKVETERYTVAVQKNGGVAPMEVTVAPEKLPELYQVKVTTVTANKELIRRELEAGRQIDGCWLGERGTSLRIR